MHLVKASWSADSTIHVWLPLPLTYQLLALRSQNKKQNKQRFLNKVQKCPNLLCHLNLLFKLHHNKAHCHDFIRTTIETIIEHVGAAPMCHIIYIISCRSFSNKMLNILLKTLWVRQISGLNSISMTYPITLRVCMKVDFIEPDNKSQLKYDWITTLPQYKTMEARQQVNIV